MKIAIISPGSFSVPPVIGSSVEHDIQMVAEQMEKEQHDVTVYAIKCPEYRRSTKEGNLAYKRFKFTTPEEYLRRIMRHIKKSKPDIVMVENRPSYVLPLKEKFPVIPIVLNMHSTVFASPPQMEADNMVQVAKSTDALLTNSKYLKNYYIKQFPDFKEKAYGVHLGINLSPFEKAQEKEEKIASLKQKYRIKDRDQTILFVGRLLREKGIHLVLEVLPRLIKNHPNLKLIITGSPRYGRDLMTPYVRFIRSRTLRLRKHVVFTNFIPPKKIPYIYQLADIVVIPSLWEEPFGRVNLEAMASTKAVVASDRGGIPEVINHEENGIIISMDNYKQELYESLSKLLESKELREQYGKKGLERVKEFTWSRTASEYLKIFDELLTREK
jgi:spore coat protein SA